MRNHANGELPGLHCNLVPAVTAPGIYLVVQYTTLNMSSPSAVIALRQEKKRPVRIALTRKRDTTIIDRDH